MTCHGSHEEAKPSSLRQGAHLTASVASRADRNAAAGAPSRRTNSRSSSSTSSSELSSGSGWCTGFALCGFCLCCCVFARIKSPSGNHRRRRHGAPFSSCAEVQLQQHEGRHSGHLRFLSLVLAPTPLGSAPGSWRPAALCSRGPHASGPAPQVRRSFRMLVQSDRSLRAAALALVCKRSPRYRGGHNRNEAMASSPALTVRE